MTISNFQVANFAILSNNISTYSGKTRYSLWWGIRKGLYDFCLSGPFWLALSVRFLLNLSFWYQLVQGYYLDSRKVRKIFARCQIFARADWLSAGPTLKWIIFCQSGVLSNKAKNDLKTLEEIFFGIWRQSDPYDRWRRWTWQGLSKLTQKVLIGRKWHIFRKNLVSSDELN